MTPTNDNDHSPKTCSDESDPNADLYQQDLLTFRSYRRASLNAQLASLFVDDHEDETTDTSSVGDGADVNADETSMNTSVEIPVQPDEPVIERSAEANVRVTM